MKRWCENLCFMVHLFGNTPIVQAPFWSAVVAEPPFPQTRITGHEFPWKFSYLVIIHKNNKIFMNRYFVRTFMQFGTKRFMPQLIKTLQSTCILILNVPPTSVLLRHIGTNLLSLSANIQFQIFSILASSTVCYNKF